MAIASTGFFDGVHLGHRQVLDRLVAEAHARGEKSEVITFWPHPRSILRQDADRLRLLTGIEEKRELLLSMGIDEVHVVKFTRDFSNLTAEEFIRDVLVKEYDVDALVIGYDHRFGKRGPSIIEEDPVEVARRLGVEAIRVQEYTEEGANVSSTAIRNHIARGEIGEAAALLGYRYQMKGVVVAGNRIGRTIGFPTANMQLYEPLKMIPMKGVYAVKATVEGKEYKGVCNIGNRPTIATNGSTTIETHILDFDDDIYGLDLKIEFFARIRDEVKFDSLAALKKQIILDKQLAESLI